MAAGATVRNLHGVLTLTDALRAPSELLDESEIVLRRLQKRYAAAVDALPALRVRPAHALREALAAGYGLAQLRADVLAGLVVGIVALPLAMALAIASGVPPQHGLYTAIVAGAVVALLGGSRTQVSGPTAAFVVVLAPVATRFGLSGLLLATMMAGAILVGLGVARLGRLIEFIPYPVTAGFTAGIAAVIAVMQLPDLLGVRAAASSAHFGERVQQLATALPDARGSSALIGAWTLGVLLCLPRLTRRVPAPLVALVSAALLAWLFARVVPGFAVDTIATRFSYELDGVQHAGIPRSAPAWAWPWSLPGAGGAPMAPSLGLLRELLPSAFAIAMLGAIESLLSAVVADGMAGTKHDPDAELVAQGVGNILAPLFGGIAATGAIARTATNVRAGARSPVAAVVHALFLLGAVLVLAPAVGWLPMPALAALLLTVAWNMSDARHFAHVLRVAPKSDALVQLTCFTLTVLFDMVLAVSVGVVLAALLFMRRMAEISGARLVDEQHPQLREPLPAGVVLYQIAGPLFFGAAQKAMSSLDAIAGAHSVVILDMSAVPVMDATGLVNLESSVARLRARRVSVILAAVQPQPERVLRRAGMVEEPGVLAYRSDLPAAAALAGDQVRAARAERTA
ncbi:MAG: C4-dicarboxylic acid transporter DauA [Polyangiaceae bacterium]